MGMQSHIMVHPCHLSGKTQHRTEDTVTARCMGLCGTCRLYLSCPYGEGVASNCLPLNGVLGFWTVILEAVVWPEHGLRCFSHSETCE